MTKKEQKKIYDLEERTAKFAEDIIEFSKKIPSTSVTIRIIPQLVGAGTSIGANYCEADNAESSKDFIHKIGVCRKESRETKYWLRVVVKAAPLLKDEAKLLQQEANELNLIFNSITHKIKNKNK